MEKKFKKLVGHYCKIVVKQPDQKRADVVTGKLEKVNYRDGFIYVLTAQGTACYRIDSIIVAKQIRRIMPVD